MLFTTSWDDGYAQDLQISELLSAYGCTGTFYICPQAQHGQKMLTEGGILSIAEHHEIGSHTLTHPRLTTVSPEKVQEEIAGSKLWIEQVTGKPCTMFCYPKGLWNAAVKKEVQDAGFTGARTCEMFRFAAEDPFILPVSIQCSAFPLRRVWTPRWKLLDPFGPLRAQRKQLDELQVPWNSRRSWLALAKHLFEKALQEDQPFFHLYGHSKEVEEMRLWEDLEAFLAFVAEHQVQHITNGELVSALGFPAAQ